MQKITPNLWFDGNAKEAVDFYVPENMGELIKKPGAYAKMMQMKNLIIDEF